ncbi:MAG: COX15/CtaA family protein, partial [Pseudomonadota bacterium]
FSETPRLLDLFERIPAAQFNHRTLAYLVAAFAGFFVYRAIKAGYRSLGLAVAGVIGVQIVLGIWAVLAMVPLWLGLAHQAGAVAILAVLTVAIYHLRPATAPAAGAIPAQTARRAAPAT